MKRSIARRILLVIKASKEEGLLEKPEYQRYEEQKMRRESQSALLKWNTFY